MDMDILIYHTEGREFALDTIVVERLSDRKRLVVLVVE
jgi:hypothetical protein